MKKQKRAIAVEIIIFLTAVFIIKGVEGIKSGTVSVFGQKEEQAEEAAGEKDFIKWVDFNVTNDAMRVAYEWDVSTYKEKNHINWIELLAYTAAKTGGAWEKKDIQEMDSFAEKLSKGEVTIEQAAGDLKYYSYYKQAYEAVLGGMVGTYKVQVVNPAEEKVWEEKYGLKAFLPIAKNFPYSDYDDFGASRTYGYKRNHLGHDMMGQIGTPIIAVESGYVEALGWNQYGGWRIGIRSFDGKRYYYYAHLRQNFPYCKTLEEGSIVTAGDVIGYMGHTGYSTTENVNNIDTVHLHFGLQLIFDESQKDGDNEIWIDCYELTKFLYQNRSETTKDEETKEWYRICEMVDPAVEEYKKSMK